MFDGFELTTIETAEASIRVRHGGSGPPLLLLHGHPQSHVMWHLVAPLLAEHFTVVATDLRGYGDSSRPPTTPDHEPYSKRAMARDQIDAMHQLGFDRFSVVGHDRGGRVAYRMALDHPARVDKLAILDILPTVEHYQRTNMEFALAYFHWFFLAQPAPFPEQLISSDPESYYFRGNRDLFTPEALAEYLHHCRNPEAIAAMCEDYRAGATYDFAVDLIDQGERKIGCPTLVLWGAKGVVGRLYDVLAVWRCWANNVRGRALDCGHYLAEEAPADTATELLSFFRRDQENRRGSVKGIG